MDKKSKKKIEDTNQQSEDLSSAIQAKKTRLNECIYEMKTLQSTISKLKQDNFLIQKRIMANENVTKRLSNNNQKEKIKETQLKEKKIKFFQKLQIRKEKMLSKMMNKICNYNIIVLLLNKKKCL